MFGTDVALGVTLGVMLGAGVVLGVGVMLGAGVLLGGGVADGGGGGIKFKVTVALSENAMLPTLSCTKQRQRLLSCKLLPENENVVAALP